MLLNVTQIMLRSIKHGNAWLFIKKIINNDRNMEMHLNRKLNQINYYDFLS